MSARAYARAHALQSHLRTAAALNAAGVSVAATSGAAGAGAGGRRAVPRHRRVPAFVRVSEEVTRALDRGDAVVALESTIISHGMPYPQNVETAVAVENVARSAGAVPATIAILDGIIHVGLTAVELERLGKLGHHCLKCSRRDLAQVVATKGNGATTVAGTMFVAHMVGIELFVTGGIGGVHRGVEETMDISADLTELGRTPVAVVCAGVKSILDIPRTLEFLETQGVSVIAYGQKAFPAFFTANSGVAAPATLSRTEDIAATILANRRLRLESGTVIGVPVPAHQAAEGAVIETATQKALQELKDKRIGGRDVTPYLLARVNELTGGKSLEANIALIKNNCLIGSQIAVHLAALQRAGASAVASAAVGGAANAGGKATGVVVIGGINQDVLGRPAPGLAMRVGTSTPGTVLRQWGGVGRNIAECIARLGVRPLMISAVGADTAGAAAVEYCERVGIDASGVKRQSEPHRTSTYLAVLDEKGDVFATTADMAVTDTLTPDAIGAEQLKRARIVVLDGNLQSETIDWLSRVCYEGKPLPRPPKEAAAAAEADGKRLVVLPRAAIPIWFEPTSVVKSLRALPSWRAGRVTILSPNVHELDALYQAVGGAKDDAAAARLNAAGKTAAEEAALSAAQFDRVRAQMQALFAVCKPAQRHMFHIVLKRGARGVVLGSCLVYPSNVKLPVNAQYRAFAAAPLTGPVVNTSGAGDTLVGACVAQLAALCPAERAKPFTSATVVTDTGVEAMMAAVACGLRAAACKVVQAASVSPLIDAQSVKLVVR